MAIKTASTCKINQFNYLITSTFPVNEVQVLITFTLVRAASVDALVKFVRAIVQVFIYTLVNIW